MPKLSRQEEYIVLFLILAILIGGAITLMKRLTPAPIPEEELAHLVTPESIAASLPPEPGEAVLISPEPEAAAPLGPRKVIVHITGAVNKPGVYQFNEGTRVIEAIKVAGGAKKGAVLDVLNLARPLIDGSRIIVPQKFDVKAFRKKLLSYGPEHVYTTDELKLAYVEIEEEKEQEEKKKTKKKSKAAVGKININTASPAQLESLPGIGPKRAEAIIANRPYSSPEEITKVHGIGPKTYQSLKDMITAD
ncbi:helix-hairpin-helix domain-containing protein [bacterium]|nr:helix-hairpin-helix domain-containing protein [bacterium]